MSNHIINTLVHLETEYFITKWYQFKKRKYIKEMIKKYEFKLIKSGKLNLE